MDEAHVEMLFDMDEGWGEDISQSGLNKYKNPVPRNGLYFSAVQIGLIGRNMATVSESGEPKGCENKSHGVHTKA